MDRPHIEALHEKASEHYLNGRFRDAQQAWSELLCLSPEDERAVEGLRLCGLLGESADLAHTARSSDASHPPAAPAGAQAPDEIQELDFDLSVLDGVASGGAEPEPVGLDPIEPETPHSAFGAQDRRAARGAVEPRSADNGFLAADDASGDPVEDQLKKRVRDLLAEARDAANRGDRDEALSILSRIAILDEDNPEASELEGALRAEISQAQQEIDHWLTEGVQWIEEGRFEEAIERFKRVLERSPSHIEARAYLAQAEERAVRGGAAVQSDWPDPANDGGSTGAPSEARDAASDTENAAAAFAPTTVWLGRETAERLSSADLRETSLETVPVPPAPARRSAGRPVVLAGVLAAALALVATGWFMLGGDESRPSGPPVETSAADPGLPETASASAPSGTVAAGTPSGTGLGNIERAERIGAAMRRAAASRARGDYEDAILAYNEVLSLDPDHQDARKGLLEAGEIYRSRKAIDDQLRKARIAFEDGEYGPALRLLYRLPDGSLDPQSLERYKFNGWMNLAITALKAGDTETALEHIGEALALRSEEPEATRLHALAESYDRIDKDRAYYVEVNRLTFRHLEQ